MAELIYGDTKIIIEDDFKPAQATQEDIFGNSLDIPEGIYFNLSNEDYQKAKGLSQSAMKCLIISPLKYWEKNINPEGAPEKETDAKDFGKLYHKYMLERDDFFNQYVVIPDKDAVKDLLVTVDDLKRYADTYGISLKGCKAKPDYIKEILFIHPEAPIWDNIVAKAEETGKIIIAESQLNEVKNADARLRSYPGMEDIYTGGYAEVSIFLKQDDIMFKARLDYITADATFDPKTFSNSKEKPVDEIIKSEITYRYYNLQALHYSEMREEARKRLKAGKLKVYGNVAPEFLKAFIDNKNAKFSLMFQESTAPNEARKINMMKAFAKGATPNVYWTNAENIRNKAIKAYKENLAEYKSKAWLGNTFEYDLVDEEIPSMLYQQY